MLFSRVGLYHDQTNNQKSLDLIFRIADRFCQTICISVVVLIQMFWLLVLHHSNVYTVTNLSSAFIVILVGLLLPAVSLLSLITPPSKKLNKFLLQVR
jgi:hypothetical protein